MKKKVIIKSMPTNSSDHIIVNWPYATAWHRGVCGDTQTHIYTHFFSLAAPLMSKFIC